MLVYMFMFSLDQNNWQRIGENVVTLIFVSQISFNNPAPGTYPPVYRICMTQMGGELGDISQFVGLQSVYGVILFLKDVLERLIILLVYHTETLKQTFTY